MCALAVQADEILKKKKIFLFIIFIYLFILFYAEHGRGPRDHRPGTSPFELPEKKKKKKKTKQDEKRQFAEYWER
jgi:hypothetical protein